METILVRWLNEAKNEFPALVWQTIIQSTGVPGTCYQFILSTTREILFKKTQPELIVEIPMLAYVHGSLTIHY